MNRLLPVIVLPSSPRTSHRAKLMRYLVVGVWNTIFGYSTFAGINWLLFHRGIPASYIYAQVISNFINITVAFLGYKFFVFKTQGNYFNEWLKAMAVYWSGFLPGLILLPALVKLLQYAVHVPLSRAAVLLRTYWRYSDRSWYPLQLSRP